MERGVLFLSKAGLPRYSRLLCSSAMILIVHRLMRLSADALRCAELVSYLVSWCFEPSQPQRITSGLAVQSEISESEKYNTVYVYVYSACCSNIWSSLATPIVRNLVS